MIDDALCHAQQKSSHIHQHRLLMRQHEPYRTTIHCHFSFSRMRACVRHNIKSPHIRLEGTPLPPLLSFPSVRTSIPFPIFFFSLFISSLFPRHNNQYIQPTQARRNANILVVVTRTKILTHLLPAHYVFSHRIASHRRNNNTS